MKRVYLKTKTFEENPVCGFAYLGDSEWVAGSNPAEYAENMLFIRDYGPDSQMGARFNLHLETEEHESSNLAQLERTFAAWIAGAIGPDVVAQFVQIPAPVITTETELDSFIRDYCAAWGIPLDESALDLGGAFGMEFSDYHDGQTLAYSVAAGRIDGTWKEVKGRICTSIAESLGFEPHHTGGGCMAHLREFGPVRVLWSDVDGTGFPEFGDMETGIGIYGDNGEIYSENRFAASDSVSIREHLETATKIARELAATLGHADTPESGHMADSVASGARITLAILREWIAPDDLAKCTSFSDCHGHCDANISIYGAFGAVHFEEFDAGSSAHTEWADAVMRAVTAQLKEGEA
jgi:hypothetical protein